MRTILPLAVQLYTLREECTRDFEGTLRAVAKMGYRGVELAGWHGMKAADLKKQLDNLKLTPIAQHVGFDQLQDLKEDFIRDSLLLGIPYWICPCLAEKDRKGVASYCAVAKILDTVGARLKTKGIQLCYHNHDFEFQYFEGRSALQWIFDTASPENLHAELDVYWIKKGGEEPVSWIEKLGKRCSFLHLKDMGTDGSFAEVGTGNIDFSSILLAARKAGVRGYVVEQDVCRGSPLDSVAISLENMRKLAPDIP